MFSNKFFIGLCIFVIVTNLAIGIGTFYEVNYDNPYRDIRAYLSVLISAALDLLLPHEDILNTIGIIIGSIFTVLQWVYEFKDKKYFKKRRDKML